MPKVRASAVIDRPAEVIWGQIRDFGSHCSWIPGAVSLELLEGAGTAVGALRRIHFADGTEHDARLTGLDDRSHRIDYDLVGDLPWPIFNVSGFIQLHSVTSVDTTFVERVVWFDCAFGQLETDALGASIRGTLAKSLDMLSL